MPVTTFIDRGSNPRNPDVYYVEDFGRSGGACAGERPGLYGTSRLYSFAERPDNDGGKPVRLTPGVRARLTKLLHSDGVHGDYQSLSDGGLVSLTHARRIAKNADTLARRPRMDMNSAPVSTSTKLPKAPSQDWRSMSDRMRDLAERMQATKAHDAWGRSQGVDSPARHDDSGDGDNDVYNQLIALGKTPDEINGLTDDQLQELLATLTGAS